MKNINLSDYLKDVRIKNNLSQRELARRAGVDNAMISRIEKGTIKKPSYKILKQISEVLNINIIELLKIAKYNNKELQALGLISEYWGIKGINIMEDYLLDNNNNYDIDLIKVFEGYKKGKMKIDELFGLISVRTGVDLVKYVPEEKRKRYGLDNMIETNLTEEQIKEFGLDDISKYPLAKYKKDEK